MSLINEWFARTRPRKQVEDYRQMPGITCVDGFTVSVQASEGHYCHPRITFDGPYEAFELGFPSADEPMLYEWMDNDWCDDPTDTVYGYVPARIVDILLAAHGGIKDDG